MNPVRRFYNRISWTIYKNKNIILQEVISSKDNVIGILQRKLKEMMEHERELTGKISELYWVEKQNEILRKTQYKGNCYSCKNSVQLALDVTCGFGDYRSLYICRIHETQQFLGEEYCSKFEKKVGVE